MPNNLTIELSVRGGREARQALAEIARNVRDVSSRANEGAEQAASGWSRLVETWHRAREGAHVAREGFSELHKSIGELKGSMLEMTERIAPRLKEALALTAAGAAAELGETVKRAAENVHQLKNLAETVGVTSRQMQQIRFAGGLAGIAPEAADTAMARFAKNWGELSIKLKQGGAAAAEAKKQLGELGLSGTGTAGKMWTAEGGMAQTLEQFRKFAEAISRIEDPLKRDALSVQYFGRSYAEIMPLISNFMSLYDRAGKLLDRYHLTIGKEEEEQAHSVEQSFTVMSGVISRERDMLGNALGIALMPLFTELSDVIGNNTESILKWGEELRSRIMPVIHDLITLLHLAVGDIEEFSAERDLHSDLVIQLYHAFEMVRSAIIQAKEAFETAGHAMMSVLRGLATVLNDVFGTQFTGEGLAAILLIGQITGAWKVLAAAIGVATAARRAFFAAGPVGAAVVAAGVVAAGVQHTLAQNPGTSTPEMDARYGLGATMASGGSVVGPSGTDRVPIWATAGEFVVNARSAASLGSRFLTALNSAPRFADGGFVGDDTLAQGISPGLSGASDLVSSILGQAHKDKAFESHPYEAPSMGERVKAGLSALLGSGAVSSLTSGILPEGITASMLKAVNISGGFGRNSMAGGRTATLQLALPNGQSFSLNGDPNDINTIIGFTRLSRLISGGKKPSYATS